MQSSASDTDICHGRKCGWSLMMELDLMGSNRRRWKEAVPTLLPGFEPLEKWRTLSTMGGMGKARFGWKSALAGGDGKLIGQKPRVEEVCP